MVELFVSVRGGSRQVVSFSAVFLLKSASFGLLLKLALPNVSVMGFGMLLTSDAGAPGVSGRCPCADACEAEKSNTKTPNRVSAAPVGSDRRHCAVDGRMARSPDQNDSIVYLVAEPLVLTLVLLVASPQSCLQLQWNPQTLFSEDSRPAET